MTAKPEYLPASPRDAEAIRQLLAANGLPHEDIGGYLGDFVVAKIGNELVGVAGFETLGAAALLRSVAVREDCRRSGVAQALCARVLAHAKLRGATHVYLLTTTAASYFQRKFAFEPLDRAAVPAAVRGTHEFSEACPQTASLLGLQL